MRKICIQLGVNEHQVLSIINDIGNEISLEDIMVKSDNSSIGYYSILSDLMLRLLRKRLVILFNKTKKEFIDYRNLYSNERRIKKANVIYFKISKRGMIFLELFNVKEEDDNIG